jgi:K+-transporting ATPase ATPase C chain
LTLLTGLAYPLFVTGLAQWVFPAQANGSLVYANGRPIGSRLIGQPFDDPKYFWGRPSATQPYAYDGAASSGSNLGPTHPAFVASVKQRILNLRAAENRNTRIPSQFPVDWVTMSGSGLDPDISPAAALAQVSRIANHRGLSESQVFALVNASIEPRDAYVLGEPRVNVFRLNLALDGL